MFQTILLSALAFVIQASFQQGIKVCQKPSDVSNTSMVDCISGFNQTVCLICPASKESDALQWNKDNEKRPIFRDKYSTNEQYRSLGVNECHDDLYSLRVPNVDVIKKSGKYICQQQGVTQATFLIKIQVVPIMSLIHNTLEGRRQIITGEGNRESVQCRISRVLPPITQLWRVNGIDQKRENFNGSTNSLQDFVSTFTFTSSSSYEKIICSCTGQRIRYSEVSAEIVIIQTTTQKGVTVSTPSDTSLILTVLLIVVPLMILTIFISTFITCRRKRRNGIPRMNQRIPLPEPPIATKFLDIPIYDCPLDKQDFVYIYGESVVYHRSDVKLTERLPGSGRMQRWRAYLETKSTKGPFFIASTLRDDSTRDDWCELRLFAEYLKNIPKHLNTVDVVGCDTNQIPHYIYTENITYGTLRDFLQKLTEEDPYSQSIYRQQYATSPMLEKSKQLAKFSLEVISGLIFLDSIDCDHPAICATKVLLNENVTCKLYDFNACSSTKKLLSAVDFKTSPQLQWFAPETFLKQEYSRASDSWSTAVLMWEVFSLGITPFNCAGLPEMKSKLEDVPPLCQPKLCPEHLFSEMTSCLQIHPENRPSLNMVKDKITDFIEGKQEDNEDDENYSRYI